jgi:hypothetical protein
MNVWRLWCYVEGKSAYFSISISPNSTTDIDNLKTEIYNNVPNWFAKYDRSGITLTKVYHDLYENINVITNGLC